MKTAALGQGAAATFDLHRPYQGGKTDVDNPNCNSTSPATQVLNVIPMIRRPFGAMLVNNKLTAVISAPQEPAQKQMVSEWITTNTSAGKGSKKKPPKGAKSVACVRDARRYPWQSYVLSDDGRKAEHVAERRRSLALQLATHANPDGTSVTVGIKRLMRDLGWKKATLHRRLDDLEELEVLSRHGRTGERGTRVRSLDFSKLKLPGAEVSDRAEVSNRNREQKSQIDGAEVSRIGETQPSLPNRPKEKKNNPALHLGAFQKQTAQQNLTAVEKQAADQDHTRLKADSCRERVIAHILLTVGRPSLSRKQAEDWNVVALNDMLARYTEEQIKAAIVKVVKKVMEKNKNNPQLKDKACVPYVSEVIAELAELAKPTETQEPLSEFFARQERERDIRNARSRAVVEPIFGVESRIGLELVIAAGRDRYDLDPEDVEPFKVMMEWKYDVSDICDAIYKKSNIFEWDAADVLAELEQAVHLKIKMREQEAAAEPAKTAEQAERAAFAARWAEGIKAADERNSLLADRAEKARLTAQRTEPT